MGVYLSSKRPHLLFREAVSSPYFVDKRAILEELVPEGANRRGQKYNCITRPRRFGKTVMANLVSAYFGKGADSSGGFENLQAVSFSWFIFRNGCLWISDLWQWLCVHSQQGVDGLVCRYVAERAVSGVCTPAGKGIRQSGKNRYDFTENIQNVGRAWGEG